MHKDGTHEHHLKNAKRQEKLSTMIKNMVGASKLRGEAKSAVPDIIMDRSKDDFKIQQESSYSFCRLHEAGRGYG